jgi:hypothetical protein
MWLVGHAKMYPAYRWSIFLLLITMEIRARRWTDEVTSATAPLIARELAAGRRSYDVVQ